VVDVERLKRTWAQVAAYGDQVPLRFYSRLFVTAPEIREMFPLSMAAQRDRLVTALGHTVSHVDDLERLVPYLQQLGRDHRRFGVAAEHYGPVAEALLATLADFLGQEWTAELAHDWAEAYGLVARTMIEAAEHASQHTPPWWVAEVVAHDRRTFDIAVLTIRPEQRYDYVPGQSMAVEIPFRARTWRYYSPANAPREDGSIDLHVRRTPGGPVSSGLVDKVQKGDTVHLGAPVGHRLTLPPGSTGDLLMIAGGTGLAPLKALVDQVAARTEAGEPPRDVTLVASTRTARELYDLDALRALESRYAWLTVVPTLTDDPLHQGPLAPLDGSRLVEHGDVAEVALRHGRWLVHEIYVCGSDDMVTATLQQMLDAGCPAERFHYEGFQGLGGNTFGVVDPGGRQKK
jgi:NAD(P)H-flavin reductase/hemoglobin-like flavoprotein